MTPQSVKRFRTVYVRGQQTVTQTDHATTYVTMATPYLTQSDAADKFQLNFLLLAVTTIVRA